MCLGKKGELNLNREIYLPLWVNVLTKIRVYQPPKRKRIQEHRATH